MYYTFFAFIYQPFDHLSTQLSKRRQTDNECVVDLAEGIEQRCGQLQINGQWMVEAFVRGL